jgi:hypothetical protein
MAKYYEYVSGDYKEEMTPHKKYEEVKE